MKTSKPVKGLTRELRALSVLKTSGCVTGQCVSTPNTASMVMRHTAVEPYA